MSCVPEGEYKTRGPQPLRPRDHAHACLVPESQILHDLAVAVDIRALQVVQQTPALPDHLEKATTTVVILLVGAEVVGQIVDAFGEDCNLNARRPSVRLVCLVLVDRCALWILPNF
jgi:hypothetical protein